jgi:1,5-anhydro-D-fructose reductase (1,5-anhydro-D-mannitol-forming)
MRIIRWGIIGCGNVTEVKSGPAFYRAPNSRLVAVMRRNGVLAAEYARRHNVPRWHDDADAILNAPDIDAVYIATHTDSHREYCVRAAQAGKHVYVEKPMAMNSGECEEMIEACRLAGVSLWVGYYRRALPRFRKIKEIIEMGAIGKVRVVVSRELQRLEHATNTTHSEPAWRTNPDISGGGMFFEGVCHTFDFLDFVFGPVLGVKALAANQGGAYKAEDIVVANYSFGSGVLGTGTWCYSADEDYEISEIIGSSGRILFSIKRPEPIRLVRDGVIEEIAIADPPHVHQPLVETIVGEMNGYDLCPSTGATALRTARVMDGILCEFRQKHKPEA